MNIKVGKQAIAEATEKLKNWGRWGKDDQIGTLNHVQPEHIVRAASLIRTGNRRSASVIISLELAAIRCLSRSLPKSGSQKIGNRSRRPLISDGDGRPPLSF